MDSFDHVLCSMVGVRPVAAIQALRLAALLYQMLRLRPNK